MDNKELLYTLNKNINLFNVQSESIQIKLKSIIDKGLKEDYILSPKQLYFLKMAYNHIENKLKELHQKEYKLSKMSEMDRLWEENSSKHWDEESGLYRSMSYNGFINIYNEMDIKIKNLIEENKKLKLEVSGTNYWER